jgi:hypothetical protein
MEMPAMRSAAQLEVHHIRFRSALGGDDLDNLITSARRAIGLSTRIARTCDRRRAHINSSSFPFFVFECPASRSGEVRSSALLAF